MASSDLPDVLGSGDHASRPAATDVVAGATYSCSTHGLEYQSDGATWSTRSTFGATGGYTPGGTDVAVADGGTGASSASAARTNLGLVIGSDVQAFDSDIPTVAASQAEMEAGTEIALRSMSPLRVAQAIAALGGGGGGTAEGVDLIRVYPQAITSGTSHSHTITAAASGDRIIVVICSYARDVNTPTCTNTTFTEVLGHNHSTGVYLSIYVGVVAGGSSGTSVTVTATGSNFIITDVYVVADPLTPTAGTTATLDNTDITSQAGIPVGPIAASAGDFFIIGAVQNNGTTSMSGIFSSDIDVQAARPANNALSSCIGRASRDKIFGYVTGGTGGADFAAGVVIVS